MDETRLLEPSESRPAEIFVPQEGPQEQFARCGADLALFGGARGGGKSVVLLMEPSRHVANDQFAAVCFRRTYPEIMAPGSLWDTSQRLYRGHASPRRADASWVWPSGGRMLFRHMQHEDDAEQWKGAQVPLVLVDQAEMFSWRQLMAMVAFNRSTCGIPPYMRWTANPDPDHPLRKFIDWWIGPDGYPIVERCGRIRWFIERGDGIDWANTAAELVARHGERVLPRSFTFIPSRVFDNPALLEQDPGYLARLESLPPVERLRHLHGNWNVREGAGMVLRRDWFPVVSQPPRLADYARGWDRAATPADSPNAPSASWTAGVKLGITDDTPPKLVVLDVQRFQSGSAEVEEAILRQASQDGHGCRVVLFQDPGAAGKHEVEDTRTKLRGFHVTLLPTAPPKKIVQPEDVHKSPKVLWARPWARLAYAGRVLLVRGDWNEAFLREAQNFDGAGICDQIDATSAAAHALLNRVTAGTWGRR